MPNQWGQKRIVREKSLINGSGVTIELSLHLAVPGNRKLAPPMWDLLFVANYEGHSFPGRMGAST